MARMPMVDPESAEPKVQNAVVELPEKLNDNAPSLHRVMAQSPNVLAAYKDFMAALPGTLDDTMRVQLALLCAEFHRSLYNISVQVDAAKNMGMEDEAIRAARRGQSDDPRMATALRFARFVLDKRGLVLDDDLIDMRDAGYSEGEIVEIVAIVAQQTFVNYIALVAGLPQEHGYVEFLKGEDNVDETSEQSFPASDPPGYS